jgi:hypothetical protein
MSMEQQDESPADAGGVNLSNIVVGEDCVYVNVSTTGQKVTSSDITVENRTAFYAGQMNDESLQGLPRPRSVSMQISAEGSGFANRYGTGRKVKTDGPASGGARRPA